MTALAALPMYDWPETRAATDAAYAALRADLPELPDRLTRPRTEAALHALWRDKRLLLAQTCWGPLGAGLLADVHVLAQPLYDDVPGGRGALYRSALVMGEGTAMPPPDAPGHALPDLTGLRLAINGPGSLSGALALAEDAGADLTRARVTGSHRASIRAVAEGRADAAAIDCRSWALALAHEPAARTLTVTGWTALRPGLPYVTSHHTEPDLRARLTDALIATGAVPAETMEAT